MSQRPEYGRRLIDKIRQRFLTCRWVEQDQQNAAAAEQIVNIAKKKNSLKELLSQVLEDPESQGKQGHG